VALPNCILLLAVGCLLLTIKQVVRGEYWLGQNIWNYCVYAIFGMFQLLAHDRTRNLNCKINRTRTRIPFRMQAENKRKGEMQ